MTDAEGPDWSTGGVFVGGLARDLACRWDGYTAGLRVTNLVECGRCGRCFQSMQCGESQGVGCAGYVKGGQFVGCYGSYFDMEVLEVRGVDLDMDPVCDHCVYGWMREGRVTYLHDASDGERNEYRAVMYVVGLAIDRLCNALVGGSPMGESGKADE